jgi:peroxin-19
MASEQRKEAEPPLEATQPSSQAKQPAPSSPPPSATEATEATAAPETKQVPPEEAPDPDEDDLSDLDDVLDEFAATNISKPTPASSGPGRPAKPAAAPTTGGGGAGPGGLFADDDEFSKSLQAGMAELLGEFESNPEMQKQFEDLVKELGEGVTAVQGEAEAASAAGVDATAKERTASAPTAPSASSASKSESTPKPATEASFQETIRATMERMSASSAAASDAASRSASNAEDDFLAAMLREMEKSGPEGLGMGSDEDFSKMLLGMMEQLTNKEILYEPMKELHDKFPGWMAGNKEKTKKEDWERYVEQQRLVGEIVGKFEEKGYSDEKVEAREYIVERMQQVSLVPTSLDFNWSRILIVLCTDASRRVAATRFGR